MLTIITNLDKLEIKMKHLVLKRSELPNKCFGVLTDKNKVGLKLYTLERPNLDNKPNVSCIPYGTYLVKPDNTGKYQWFSIKNVVGRTAIEIHPANRVEQLMGCIAPGMDYNIQYDMVRSQDACEMLKDYVGNKAFILEIVK